MTQPRDERLRDTVDAAGYLDLPPRTLDMWRYKGTGPPYIKIGRHVRYRQSDLDRYLDSRTVDPTATP